MRFRLVRFDFDENSANQALSYGAGLVLLKLKASGRAGQLTNRSANAHQSQVRTQENRVMQVILCRPFRSR